MFEVVFLRLEERGRVVVNRDRGDLVANAVVFAAALAGIVFTGDFFHDVEAVGDLAEDRVTVVEEGSGDGRDEELRAVRAGAGVGHGEDAG